MSRKTVIPGRKVLPPAFTYTQARVAGISAERLYAYRDRCPACNVPLHLGTLESGLITCLEGHRFSVPGAGLSPDDPASHLDPFPLLDEGGAVRVALASDHREPNPQPTFG